MKCIWCGRTVWTWQRSCPLGGGFLLNDYGQREHEECQEKRFQMIADGEKRFAETLRIIRERESGLKVVPETVADRGEE